MTCPQCDNGCALCRSPYPKVTLIFVDGLPVFVEEETDNPVSILEIYGMLVFYRDAYERGDEQVARLYRQMANTVRVKPVPVMENK